MKKVIIIVFLFMCITGYSQYKIHIDENIRTVYTYYQEKGFNVKVLDDEYEEKGKIIKLDNETLDVEKDENKFEFTFHGSDKKCEWQCFTTFDRNEYYRYCDYLKVSDNFNKEIKKTIIDNIKYEVYSMTGTTNNKKYYKVIVRKGF